MTIKKNRPTSQSDAIIAEVKRTCGDRFVVGKTEAKKLLSLKDIDKIANSISDKIERKEVYYGKTLPERPVLFRYVKTVIFNLLNQNKKLNGGINYEPVSERRKKENRENAGCSCSENCSHCRQCGRDEDEGTKKANFKKRLKENPVESFSTTIYSDEAPLILERFEK